jgi:hypothetical protein
VMLLEAADLAHNMALWFLNNETQPIAIGARGVIRRLRTHIAMYRHTLACLQNT